MTNLPRILVTLQVQRKQTQQRLTGLDKAISALSGLTRNGVSRRTMSAAARRRIAAAQRARWAKVRAQSKGNASRPGATPKRTLSAAARQRIAAAQRARWAKWKKAKRAA